jgi:hypothetical protein
MQSVHSHCPAISRAIQLPHLSQGLLGELVAAVTVSNLPSLSSESAVTV